MKIKNDDNLLAGLDILQSLEILIVDNEFAGLIGNRPMSGDIGDIRPNIPDGFHFNRHVFILLSGSELRCLINEFHLHIADLHARESDYLQSRWSLVSGAY